MLVTALRLAAVLVLATALQPRTAAAELDDHLSRLAADVASLVPAAQDVQRLAAKVTAAVRSVGRGDLCAAVGQLGALRNELLARRDKKELTVASYATLDADALRVLSALLGSPLTTACGGTAAAPAGAAGPQVTVASSDVTGLRLEIRLPPARFVPREGGGRGFVELMMDGFVAAGRVGAPSVPALMRHFGVPLGADVVVEVVAADSYTLPGIDLWPAQREPPDAEGAFADPPFVYDAIAYATASAQPPTPARAAVQGQLRDVRMGAAKLYGAQYSPAPRSLRVFTRLEVAVRFVGGSAGVFGDAQLTSVWNLPFQQLYETALDNWTAVRSNLRTAERPSFCGEESLVVTSSWLRPAADQLAAAQRQRGIDARVVEVGTAPGQIGGTADAIRLYIVGELTAPCLKRPSYVTLVGDETHIPRFLVDPQEWDPGFDGLIATDLLYVLVDLGDRLPEAAIGRVLAGDVDTALAVVDKIVRYQTAPPSLPEFYTAGAIASYFESSWYGEWEEMAFIRGAETIRSALLAQGYAVDRIYYANWVHDPTFYHDGGLLPAELRRPQFEWDGSAEDILAAWNAGRFFVLHRDHGQPTGWVEPHFVVEDLASLTNGDLLPVVFSINCATGKFDEPTPGFAEQVLQLPSGGAVGVIAATRNSPSRANTHLTIGMFDAIFPDLLHWYGSAAPLTRMGDVLTAGKVYVDTQVGTTEVPDEVASAQHVLWHWFGDPTMQIWTSAPSRFDRPTWAAGAEGIRVQLAQADADGAVLTLVQDGVAIGRAVLSGGEAVVPFEATPAAGVPISLSVEKGRFVATQVSIALDPGPACPDGIPDPVLELTGAESADGATVYRLRVANFDSYPDALFAATSLHGACGDSPTASRTVADLRSAGVLLRRECLLTAASDLQDLTLSIPAGTAAPAEVWLELQDRACGTSYRSSPVSLLP